MSSGLRLPTDPRGDADPFTVAMHYLEFYENEYARTRRLDKRRARTATTFSAMANGGIAVISAAIAYFKVSWLGLFGVALASLIGVVAAWDALFQHRTRWAQRTMALSQLQALKRTTLLRRASGESLPDVAADALAQLNQIISDDTSAWMDVRRMARQPLTVVSHTTQQ
jgi:hypothetical protein